jgi:hypothetical protein
MAKGTASKAKARQSGQKSIASFFGGGTSRAEEHSEADTNIESNHETENTEPEDDVSMAEAEDQPSDVDMDAPNKTKQKAPKTSAPDASDLPPIHEIPVIFDDLVSRIAEIKDVAVRVAGRKLRVATMCSGTESPLLALELIQKSVLEQHGVNLDIEHVFSCEIEPFKQAYIERNFYPPLLFRDVCELGDGEAYVLTFPFTFTASNNSLGTLRTVHWHRCLATLIY